VRGRHAFLVIERNTIFRFHKNLLCLS
jgi:hypothetical protein